MPIHIPQDDPIRALFPSGSLPFRRSRRALVRKSRERPLNSLSSALDLSAVYGVDERRNMALRTLKDGKMRVSKGDMLPYNRRGFVNSPSGNKAFFLAGDHRANEHPVLTSIHTLFVREHNSICDDLRLVSKKWNDEDMFQFARVINVAQFQKIVFNEFYPAFVGSPLPPYTGYKRRMNPTVSNVFSTAAFRVGHTMVSDVIYRHPKNRDPLRPLSLKDSFFKSHVVLKKDIDQFIRGAAHQRAQEIDLNVTSALRNFLFRRVRHETGFDLVALNLQRSRDHALVSYARIRKRLQYPEVKTWSDISSDLAIQAELKRVYGLARTVEAWIGLIAEDKVKGSSFGKTMGAIWRMEFVRLRNGDYFYYRRAGAVPKEIRGISRMKRVFRSRALLKDIILRNTNITRRELPVGTNSIFFA